MVCFKTSGSPMLSGNATFHGLSPGTYRAAVPDPSRGVPSSEEIIQEMMNDTARRTSAVTVDEGQTAVINFDLP